MTDKQIKFDGDRYWWTVQASDERFTILTRQAEFQPKGTICYTIIDAERGVRGPCNLIGQGWDFDADTLHGDAQRLLRDLQTDEVEISHRNNVPIRVTEERKA